MPQTQIITIDGPSGVGKGTVARTVAEYLNCPVISIGDIHRITAYRMQQQGIDINETEKITKLLSTLTYKNTPQGPVENNELLEDKIRSDDMGTYLAKVLTYNKEAKQAIVDYYKSLANKYPIVIYEGREAGSFAFPDAVLKIHITASPEERAKRAITRDREHGITDSTYEEKYAKIAARDKADADPNKPIPSAKADDATEIDTSEMSKEEIASAIINLDKLQEIQKGNNNFPKSL